MEMDGAVLQILAFLWLGREEAGAVYQTENRGV